MYKSRRGQCSSNQDVATEPNGHTKKNSVIRTSKRCPKHKSQHHTSQNSVSAVTGGENAVKKSFWGWAVAAVARHQQNVSNSCSWLIFMTAPLTVPTEDLSLCWTLSRWTCHRASAHAEPPAEPERKKRRRKRFSDRKHRTDSWYHCRISLIIDYFLVTEWAISIWDIS